MKQLLPVLSIAGSDSSGGAGIQADIKTITAHKMYAMTAITALTAQNTTGVFGIYNSSAEFIASQIDAIFTDIEPCAVKIGMLSASDIIEKIADRLSHYKARHIVLDPVMIATTGGILLEKSAYSALTKILMPLAEIITPNIPEAEVLAEMKISSPEEMLIAAKKIREIHSFSAAILIKGGHLKDSADDLLYTDKPLWLKAKHIETNNTHGTGCTLSSAIACNLAKGKDLPLAVQCAKQYVFGALEADLKLGHGSGPLNHMWQM